MRGRTIILFIILIFMGMPFVFGGVSIPSRPEELIETIVEFLRFWFTGVQEFIRSWLKMLHDIYQI